MNAVSLIDICKHALELMLICLSPFLLTTLVMGIVIGLLQAVTQLQDPAIAFVPKILILCLVLFLSGNFVLGELTKLMRDFFIQLAEVH